MVGPQSHQGIKVALTELIAKSEVYEITFQCYSYFAAQHCH